MRSLNTILNKKYRKKLLKLTHFKKRLKKIQSLLKVYGISCNVKDEWGFYQVEVIYESILNKQEFENTYFATYASMHDYWNDLDYQERRHQMNVDIDRMRRELKSFPCEGEEIYIPMFDQRMNRIYRQEIVMLELKQYGKFIKNFQDIIYNNLYGCLPYKYNFSSCLFITGDDSAYSLYSPDLNRIYFIQNETCVDYISFDSMKSASSTFEEIRAISSAYMEKDLEKIIDLLLNSNLISERMKNKLSRYYKKSKLQI